MNLSDKPYSITTPWANSAPGGNITNPIPVSSQPNGLASFTDGFPPINTVPVSAGGVPPYGPGFNGIFYVLSAWARWQAVGGPEYFDGTVSGLIGGYPKGATLASATTIGLFWINQVDANTTNPDSGGSNWLQFPPSLPPGATSRLGANLTSAGTAVTFTADYISASVTIGTASFSLANYSQMLNAATTGAGGMDTGSLPASGFVSIYAIFNSATGATSILGTTACQTGTYTGSNMPAGYNASALIAIWPTNSSSQMVPGTVVDQQFVYQGTGAGGTPLSGGTATGATAISLSGGVPAAARSVYGNFFLSDSLLNSNSFVTFGSTTGLHQIFIDAQVANIQTGFQQTISFATAQTIYYAVGHNTAAASMQILGYSI